MAVTADLLNKIQDYRQQGYTSDEIVQGLAQSANFGDVAKKVRAYSKGGYSSDEILQGIQSSPVAKDDAAKMRSRFMRDEADASTTEAARKQFVQDEGTTGTRIKEAAKSATKATMPYVRPVLEGGGAALGGIAGAGAGGLAGLGAGTIPGAAAGGVAGGALGYAMGKNLADTLEGDWAATPQEAATRTLADLVTGATYEMGGQGGAKLLGAGINQSAKAIQAVKGAVSRNAPAVTKAAIDSRAGQILAENSGTAPIYEQNAAAAAKVDIPGYKPSIGEARNDPGLIKLQRGIERQPGTAGSSILEQKAANQGAVRDYLQNEFTGNESIDDVVNALQQKKAAIEAVTAQSAQGVDVAKAPLNPTDNQTVGRDIVETIDKARLPAKQEVSDLYDAIPNDPIPTTNTASAVKDLKGGFRPGDEEVYPSRAISRVEEALQGPKPSQGGHGKPADPVILDATGKPLRDTVDPTKAEVGFQDLHSLRKDLGRQIQDATSGAKPNRELAMKLQQLKDAVDADIEAGMGAKNAYVDARQAFADYANRFRTGQVERITRKGMQASGRNIPDAAIAKRVFSPDGADDFIRAAGKDKAAAHADQYAANDLLSRANPMTGEISADSVAKWIRQNSPTLNKYGILGKYNTVAKAQAQLELARLQEKEFTKSAASRILNADVDKAIGSAFSSNPSNTAAVADELLKQIGNNPQGVKGLQNAFKDFIVSKVETTAKTLEGDNILSPAAIQKELAKYAPAMRRLYANDPSKISALQKVSKAVEIQGRSARSPIGGGSDTAENINATLGKIVNMAPDIGFTRKLARWGLGKLNELGAQEVNKVIARALYDPELAQTLMLAAQRAKPEIVAKRINSHLITMGLAATDPLGNDKENQ